MGYRVKKEFQKFAELTTVVDGVRVALNGAYEHKKEGTIQSPPKTISVPLATQAQMKLIFERGDPCVEQFEEPKFSEPKNSLADYVPKNPFGGVPKELIEEAQGAGKKKTVKNEP